uniref:Uncharacterized protein n=1 Tax=Balaenoptera musculus TaxID=9771 RepID=A0A8C0I233_BALMU
LFLFYHCQGFFHSSAMEQPSWKTRAAPKPVNHHHRLPRGAGVGVGGAVSGRPRTRGSHDCFLSARGPSHKPRARPPLGLVFILG